MSTRVTRGTFRRSCRSCGWSGTYDTAARGDYAKRKHSCALTRQRAEKRARQQTRMAGVDRTPKPCLHKVAQHQHGTYACYVLDGCRCEPCTRARTEWRQQSERQKAYGRWDNLVDATAAREHVSQLNAQGMGLKRIVAVSDISHGQLWKLMYGKTRADGSRTPSRRIRKVTAERILAVELDLADGAVIDGTGARRRLQALVAIGYSQRQLADELGVLQTTLGDLIHGGRETVISTDRAVRALYDRLSMTPAVGEDHRSKISVRRTLAYAHKRGWIPPLAWDDDTIDDPAATPLGLIDSATKHDVDEMAVERAVAGDPVDLTVAERREVVRRLHAQGFNDVQIARRAGFTDRTALRIRQELGLAAVEPEPGLSGHFGAAGERRRRAAREAAAS